MDRSSMHDDYSNKIYDDRASSPIERSLRSIQFTRLIVSRMQADAIRMWYYRGPLAIVCEENGRVNCHRSVNHKGCMLRRRSRKLIGALLQRGILFCLIWRVFLSIASRCTFRFLAWIALKQYHSNSRGYCVHTYTYLYYIRLQIRQNEDHTIDVVEYTIIQMMTCFVKRTSQNCPRRSVNVVRNARRATLDGNTGPIHSSSSGFLSFMALWNSSSDNIPSRSTSTFFISESIKSYNVM